jgi:hypothetical protein
MKITRVGQALALASLVLITCARAQDITALYIEDSPTISALGTFNGTNFATYNAGLSQFDSFEAFCIEPLVTLPVGSTVGYDIFDLSPPAVATAISHLVGGFYASSQDGLNAAAVQWAIWEVLTDGMSSPSLSTGNAQVQDVSIATLGDTYLANYASMPIAEVTYLTNATHQNVVGLTADVIPEPSALGLCAVAALLLLRRGRK